ncbi:putative cysteine-rich receptor-like protein kinase 30 [Impatiens glandulifera]|uniref:putative cysteine-rich receptor-like protein kinase 30 n=1 Tax=Impatiens glandulifera TaxID=253017 RepID=UPI001FB17A60|nr:putative cysteine-rich receptor-like protein kinase 30 [Impatiens glandulifera]
MYAAARRQRVSTGEINQPARMGGRTNRRETYMLALRMIGRRLLLAAADDRWASSTSGGGLRRISDINGTESLFPPITNLKNLEILYFLLSFLEMFLNFPCTDLKDFYLFSLRQIEAATNSFDTANKIGEGGFGPVYKICIGLARGLAFLHEESWLKIVHRDIKATNVLLDKDLNPKISDFGLAQT